MIKATKCREPHTTATGAIQTLYRLDPPPRDASDDGEPTTLEYVVVSALPLAFDHGEPETLIFRGNAEGEIISFLGLPGSYRGAADADRAIRNAGWELA